MLELDHCRERYVSRLVSIIISDAKCIIILESAVLSKILFLSHNFDFEVLFVGQYASST